MRTIVVRPLRRLMHAHARIHRSVRCAAVSAYMSKRSPLAVGRRAARARTRTPCPRTPRLRRHATAADLAHVDAPRRHRLGAARGERERQGCDSSHRRLAAGCCKRLLPQLMSRRSVAQRRARLFAVPLAEDVAQVGHELRRCPSAPWCGSCRRRSARAAWSRWCADLEPGLFDVLRSRPVAGLALHVDEPRFSTVARLTPPGFCQPVTWQPMQS